ncbi:Putative general secretion pathway II protein, GspE-like [Desulfonema magnum]|uniref:General secretion pathway II protein, GspE-like n=2 Tax=Desulfonema magnum TaxID=45655 RepID=A0A975BJY1_9BACT|nr:Putative general secretion pathway II protein, GspE-like [Desulfonema magnum]
MLVDIGLLNNEDLEKALINQKKTNMKLGEFLVQEGLVSDPQMLNIISEQLGVKKYRPDKYPINVNLSEILPIDMAQNYQAAPLKKNGSLLIMAMTDPMNINALDAIEAYTDIEVEAVICTEQQLNFLITNIYGAESGIGGVLGDMEAMHYNSGDEDMEKLLATEDVEVKSLQGMAEESGTVRLVNAILSQAVNEGASDVHISPEKDSVQVRFRVDGKLRDVPAPPKSMILPIVSRFKILANMDISVSRIPQDGRFTARMNNKEINVRASIIPTIYGENLVLRILDTSTGIYALEQLGMAEEDRDKIESTITKPYGMILSTGPTGSGKTTTLYSVLKKINQPDINIITLEDPVEYRIEKIRQTQLNRKAGMTFASGIRSILRQDPDVIMVGEIRDPETATIAVQSALTGHRVLSTIHTNDAAGTITRFVDMGIEPFLISSVLLLSIAQRLVRKVCPYCKQPYDPPSASLKYWGLENVSRLFRDTDSEGRGGSDFMQAKGCFNCMNTGYKGRIGVFEVLVIDEMIQNMIIENRPAHEITRAAKAAGKFKSLKENVTEKILKGITTMDEAASAIMT